MCVQTLMFCDWLPPLKVGHIEAFRYYLQVTKWIAVFYFYINSILFLAFTTVGPLCLTRCPSLNSTRLGSIFLSKLDNNTFSMVCTYFVHTVILSCIWLLYSPHTRNQSHCRPYFISVWHHYSFVESMIYYLVVRMYERVLYCHCMTLCSMNTILLRKQLSKYRKARPGRRYVYLRTIPKTFVRGLSTLLEVKWRLKLSMALQSTFTWMSQVWNSKSDCITMHCMSCSVHNKYASGIYMHAQRCYLCYNTSCPSLALVQQISVACSKFYCTVSDGKLDLPTLFCVCVYKPDFFSLQVPKSLQLFKTRH